MYRKIVYIHLYTYYGSTYINIYYLILVEIESELNEIETVQISENNAIGKSANIIQIINFKLFLKN